MEIAREDFCRIFQKIQVASGVTACARQALIGHVSEDEAIRALVAAEEALDDVWGIMTTISPEHKDGGWPYGECPIFPTPKTAPDDE